MPDNLPKVYLETTVISYLTARPHRDVVVAGHQLTTREWWITARDRFEILASELVVQEAGRGDSTAAKERRNVLMTLPLLQISDESLRLSRRLVAEGAVPASVIDDALHLAIAALNEINYLVTCNCRHLANMQMRPKIETVCREWGCEAPRICTPELLM